MEDNLQINKVHYQYFLYPLLNLLAEKEIKIIFRCCCRRLCLQNKFFTFVRYSKIPIISPELTFVQKAFLLGLFLGELIFRGASYWNEFCVSNTLGLTIKTQPKTL